MSCPIGSRYVEFKDTDSITFILDKLLENTEYIVKNISHGFAVNPKYAEYYNFKIEKDEEDGGEKNAKNWWVLNGQDCDILSGVDVVNLEAASYSLLKAEVDSSVIKKVVHIVNHYDNEYVNFQIYISFQNIFNFFFEKIGNRL